MNKLIDYLKARIINNMLWVFTLIIIIAIGVHFIVKISDYFASGRQDKLKAKTEKFYKVVSLDSLNNRFDSITATKCDSTAKYYLSRVKSRKNEKEIARIEFYAPKDTSCEYNLKNCAKYASILEADNSDLSIAADTLKASGVKKDAIIERLTNNLFQAKVLVNDWRTIATKPKNWFQRNEKYIALSFGALIGGTVVSVIKR